MRDRTFVVVSLCLSAAYFFNLAPGPARAGAKAASILALAALVFFRGHLTLSAGLALSSLGDALLEMSAGLFTAGLLAFLCAHLVYTAVFLRTPGRPALSGIARLAIAAVVVFSGGFSAWLVPSVGGLAAPVALYIGAITMMVISSIVGLPGKWVPVGAALFLISDAILAANRFKAPIPGRDVLVWWTYYFGQFLIAMGYLAGRSQVRETEPPLKSPEKPDIASHATGRGQR